MKNESRFPVLILAFNRPHLVKKLLPRLELSKISEIFVSIDGPQNESDVENADLIIKILSELSTKVPIRIKRGKSNLGCRLGVISGLDWFFNQVTEGLVLEDDCHPKDGLFDFIATYKDLKSRHRIGMITAHNPFGEIRADYHLSRYAFIHGWYMKKEIWQEIRKDIFAVKLPDFTVAKHRKVRFSETIFWWSAYMRARIGPHDTWDALFYRAFTAQRFYCLVPQVNLIENHGFGSGATHTTNAESSILIKNGPEIATTFSSPDQIDHRISHDHFRIRARHTVTPLVKVAIDLIKVRHFPDYEKQIRKSQNSDFFLNQEVS